MQAVTDIGLPLICRGSVCDCLMPHIVCQKHCPVQHSQARQCIRSQLRAIAMQGFLQRCQNYLSKTVVEQVIMRLARNIQRQFMRESGLRVHAYEQGLSTSAAAIVAADWAIEYPHPIPPKVHVSLRASWHNARHDHRETL